MTDTAGTGRGLLAALLTFRGVLAFWAVYGVAHSLLRLSYSRSLILDDARANELVQSLELGYEVRQPPLYEWLLWFSQQAFGTGIESHLVVRYSLIAALGIATFGAVRAAVRDDRWAAVASLSLVMSYPVGWTFHGWATQTLLLCIACMATLHAAIRFCERPGGRTSVFLGLALALGAYSKFSFPLFLGGLVLAAASIRETREHLVDRRLLISVAIALVAFAPYAMWVVQVRGDPLNIFATHLVHEIAPYMERVAVGLWRLVLSLPVFLLPWLLFVALFVPDGFRRAPAGAPAPSFAERLALRTMIFAAALAALGIVAIGATNIAERYMHPILFIAPVYVFARIVRIAPEAANLRRLAVFALAAAMSVLGVRLVSVTENPITRAQGRSELLPYAELAEALNQRGIRRGTVVTTSVREAGNLRAYRPELRVIAAASTRAVPPPRRLGDTDACIFLWREGHEPQAGSLLSVGTLPVEKIEIEERPGFLAWSGRTWYFVRLQAGSPLCA